MRILLKNPSNTIGLCELEIGDKFSPMMITDATQLKELTKLLANYEPDVYEIGILHGKDTDLLVLEAV